MDPLDVARELEVHTEGDVTTVRIPLIEPGDWADWVRAYNPLARSEGLRAQVAPEPDGCILTVEVASDTSREETFHVLDAAVALIERAKAEAKGKREASVSVAQDVSDWWSTQGHSRA